MVVLLVVVVVVSMIEVEALDWGVIEEEEEEEDEEDEEDEGASPTSLTLPSTRTFGLPSTAMLNTLSPL